MGFSSNMQVSLTNNRNLRGRKPFDNRMPMPVYSKKKRVYPHSSKSFVKMKENRELAENKKLIGYLTVVLIVFVVTCGYFFYL